MDPGLIFAIGTLAAWAGWIALFRVIYLVLRSLLGASKDPLWTGVAIGLFVSAIGFLVSGRLLQPAKEGWRLPIVWLVMPFLAWLAVISLAFGVARGVQAILAVHEAERMSRWKSAGIWAILAVCALALFLRSKDPVEILQGGIIFSTQSAAAFLVLIAGTLAAIVATAKSARFRGVAKATANHLALLVGSLVFGLPFAWAVITSFKEDQDMSSANGLVWIPHVKQQVPYFDPQEVHAEGTFQGQRVEGIVQTKLPDGSAKLEIIKPAVLRGMSFVEPQPKIVPKMIDVVTGTFEGQSIKGRVLRETADGLREVEVMEPATVKGKVYEAKPEEVEFVRPVGLKYSNYPEALDYLPPETLKGLVYLKNTLIIVILSVIGTLLSSSVVAYAFARLRFPGKNHLFLLLLSTMMLPAAVTLIPQFLIFRSLGWIDTLRPLWFTAFLGSAFNIFLLRQFFMTIPLELEDAAKIDGCSYPRTFWQVMLPQVKPALAVVAIWTFMGAWNNFMGPLIYINSPENMPISYAVQLFQGDRLAEPGLLMAFATMAMLPVLLVFFFAQRYFIEGVTLSGLGGR